jgi:hypothetical protein
MQGDFIIKPIEIINDSNGTLTAQSNLSFEGDYIIAKRLAGTTAGNHYHKGLSQTKNPEKLILISGEATLRTKNILNNDLQEVTLTSPVEVHIYPNVLHALDCKTDILFIELNSIQEHKDDTFYDVGW